jgi:hypothetical protein
MAARNSSRGTRLSGRSGGNRPRTHPTPQTKRMPVTPKRSKLHTASTGDRRRRAKAILKAARAAEPARAADEHLRTRATRDGMPADELLGIRRRLKLVQSCTLVVEAALRDQNCELDSNAADILATHVIDVLHIQILKIDRLLGRKVHKDDIEEDEGGAS